MLSGGRGGGVGLGGNSSGEEGRWVGEGGAGRVGGEGLRVGGRVVVWEGGGETLMTGAGGGREGGIPAPKAGGKTGTTPAWDVETVRIAVPGGSMFCGEGVEGATRVL